MPDTNPNLFHNVVLDSLHSCLAIGVFNIHSEAIYGLNVMASAVVKLEYKYKAIFLQAMK